MRRSILAMILISSPLASAADRIDYMRHVPARYDLANASEIAILYGIGDNDSVETFVSEFAEHTNRAGPIHLADVTAHGAHFIGQKPDDRTIQKLKRENRADAYMGVTRFTCEFVTRNGE